jgi:lipoprotein-anchoring transpeptidase ErfK/SrfK
MGDRQMDMARTFRGPTLGILLAMAAGAAAPLPSAAQVAADPEVLSYAEVRDSPVIERGDYLVVIDVDRNRLHFMQGLTVLWSAPVATGMDLKLEAGSRTWQFSTPPGEYQVQYKEENPVWNAPDWYFIENRLPVPPQDDPRRRIPGGLGVAAVHIGRGLAIHGTDKPDLLGQRVSHGCIRLANEYAQRLFHNVQVGTKVLIVGREERTRPGRLVPGQVPGAGPVDARTQRLRDHAKAQRARLLGELNALSTERLLDRLDTELRSRTSTSPADRWTETAGVLVGRAVRDEDADAARGLLDQWGEVRDPRTRAEFATYLADLYRRGSPATARALARMEGWAQQAAAEVIVAATLALFSDGPDFATAPWPTRRIPRTALAADAQHGWDVIQGAERTFRERRNGAR